MNELNDHKSALVFCYSNPLGNAKPDNQYSVSQLSFSDIISHLDYFWTSINPEENETNQPPVNENHIKSH